MSSNGMHRTSVSALMGMAIVDADGKPFGRVSEFAVAPLDDAAHVKGLVVKRAGGPRGSKPSLVSIADLKRDDAGNLRLVKGAKTRAMTGADDFLLLERDLLDQQIIDVHGHKVVRVNDVDMFWESVAPASNQAGEHDGLKGELELTLRIAEVEVGVRGAMRRLLKGLPQTAVDRIACRVRPMVIPWDFVDLIDRDPARRVRLKIEQDRLAKMHPSDLADILEELAPKERQALFSSLDEEVAAEALEEIEPKMQKTLIESLDSERVAGIIEEMDPGAAADLLSELTEERSDAILEEMEDEARHDVEELLERSPDSAEGLMTTEFVAVAAAATVGDGIAALRAYEGDVAAVTDIFLVDESEQLIGLVPLSRIMLAPHETALAELHEGHTVYVDCNSNGRKVAELFDKYNLRCLPVVGEEKKLAGVIHAEHVIAWLRTE